MGGKRPRAALRGSTSAQPLHLSSIVHEAKHGLKLVCHTLGSHTRPSSCHCIAGECFSWEPQCADIRSEQVDAPSGPPFPPENTSRDLSREQFGSCDEEPEIAAAKCSPTTQSSAPQLLEEGEGRRCSSCVAPKDFSCCKIFSWLQPEPQFSTVGVISFSVLP